MDEDRVPKRDKGGGIVVKGVVIEIGKTKNVES